MITSLLPEITHKKESLMKFSRTLFITFFIVAVTVIWLGCNKPNDNSGGTPYVLNYGDSILFLKPTTGDYIVYPLVAKSGTFEAFPEGIEIDDNTGAINVSKSETGLRYKITHTANDGKKTTTMVVLSGINFTDKFYRLSQNDSMAFPVYNANPARTLPVTGSIFDDGGGAGISGCDVKTVNGQINLAQSIRNGLFGNNPTDDQRRDVEIVYRLNDGSNKAVNKLKVRLYYYTSMATVAPDLLQTLQDRENDGVFLRGFGTESTVQAARPRPPCVIIIAN